MSIAGSSKKHEVAHNSAVFLNAREKRKHVRHKTSDLSEILYVGSKQGFACRVVDISLGGAKLEVSRSEIPNKFTLVNHVKFTRTLCKMVWRKDNMVGVKFISSPRPMPIYNS
ncbi:MAG: PilZ domain-containing protein [Nitratireductor sp.]